MNAQVQAIRKLILSNDVANVRLGVAFKHSIQDWDAEMERRMFGGINCDFCNLRVNSEKRIYISFNHYYSNKPYRIVCHNCHTSSPNSIQISGHPNLKK